MSAGCYGTRSAPATRVSALKQGGHGREIVLKQGPLGVHIGPRSWVRFALRDGRRTPWFEAGSLRVSDLMIVTTDGQPHPLAGAPVVGGLAWEDLASIEVNDLDLGKSVLGVCAGSGVVAVAATTELLLIGALEAITGGHANSDLGITRGAFDMVVGEALKRPEDAAEVNPEMLDASVDEVAKTRPLFSGRAQRRDLTIFTFAAEGGFDAMPTLPSDLSGGALGAVGGVAVGLRLVNIFELGLGVRSSLVAPATDAEPARIISTPFFRMGLHLDLDAARRVAVAVGADLGGLPGEGHARFLYGVRVRLTDRVQLGLYPWNPVGISRYTEAGQQVSSSSRLNLLELSWLL